jgi:hypothetical protein
MSPRLPQYKGDLELINHSAGSPTSQAYHVDGSSRTNRWGCSREGIIAPLNGTEYVTTGAP